MKHYINRSKNQLFALLYLLISPISAAYSQDGSNSYVFYGGDILTMAKATYQPNMLSNENENINNDEASEALWIKDGIIQYIGNKELVLNVAQGAVEIDLKGNTLMPGFIEPHTHLPLVISFSEVTDLSPCLPEPYEYQYYDDDESVECPTSLEGTFETLNGSVKRQLSGTNWIVANGIDPSRLGNDEESAKDIKNFINGPAQTLDKKVHGSDAQPIFLLDQSGHVAYVNKQAFIAAGICKESESGNKNEACGPDNLVGDVELPGELGTWVVGPDGNFTGKLMEEPAYELFMLAIINAMAGDDNERRSALMASPFFFMTKEKGLEKAPKFIDELAKKGITTIVNAGGFKESEVLFFKELAEIKHSKLRYRSLVSADIIAVPSAIKTIEITKTTKTPKTNTKDLPVSASPFTVASRLKTAVWDPANKGLYGVYGVKLWVDGSTQGCSAYLASNYSTDGICQGTAADQGANYKGSALFDAVKPFWSDWQVQVHANGDMAMAKALETFSTLQSRCEQGVAANNQPIVLHHATIGGDPQSRVNIAEKIARYRSSFYDCNYLDKIDYLAKLDISVSHTAAHIAYWGGSFESILDGKGQVKKNVIEPDTNGRVTMIDPIALETKLGIPYSLHSDVPVSPANPLWYVEQVVTRNTWVYPKLATNQAEPMPVNQVVGVQNSAVYQALRGITIVPATQNQLSNYIGSLEQGKVADLVILDKNPLKVNPHDIHHIQVMNTFVNGVKHDWIENRK